METVATNTENIERKIVGTNDGRPMCFYCGTQLIWDSSEQACYLYPDYSEDDSATVDMWHCPLCGRSIEVVEPNEEERKTNYNNYWKENL